MQLIADPLRPGITETAIIDPLELEAALEADATTDAEGTVNAESKEVKP
jgi:hypothetical protein